MRQVFVSLLAWLSLACEELVLITPPESDDSFFLIEEDDEGRRVRPPDGPWAASEIPKRWSLDRDHRLTMIGVNPEALGHRYPSFEPVRRASLALRPASVGLEECVAEGLLGEEGRALAPLEALADAVSVTTLGPEDLQFQGAPLPGGLALEWDAAACNDGPKPILFPFGTEEEPGSWRETNSMGAVEAMDSIRSDAVVLIGSNGLARVTATHPSGSSAIVATYAELMPSRAGKILGKTGAVVVRGAPGQTSQVVAAIAIEDPGANVWELGLARFTITGTGGFELAAYHALTEGPIEGPWLRQIRVEPDGRYIGITKDWLVTADSATATPTLLPLVAGFDGRWILPLPGESRRHLVLGSRTAFEGDAFQGISATTLLETYASNEVGEAFTGTFLPSDSETPVVSFDDGRLRIRNADHEWVEYPFAVPPEAKVCGGAASRCGRHRSLEASYLIAGTPGLNGLIISTAYCSAFFFRSTRDSCARSFAFGGYDHTTQARSGLAAVTEMDGQLLIATPTRQIYTLGWLVE